MATFESLHTTRQPKAVKAISLLANLAKYEHTEDEAKELVNSLFEAVDEVDAAFTAKWGWDDAEEVVTDEPAPSTTADDAGDLLQYLGDLYEKVLHSTPSEGFDGYDVDMVRELMAYVRLHDTADIAPEPTEQSAQQVVGSIAAARNGQPWAHVMDMAKEAPLADLSRAMAVFLTRLDEEAGL